MKIDPRAGQPALASDLVDVPKLIAAYYEERPDADIAEQRVVFGTSGHRGSSFTKTFNEWHILAITQAICLYRKQKNIDGPLFLGIDTHALSQPAVDSALEVLAANGVDVMLAGPEEYTPTPVISHAILTYNRGRTAGFADGIVITPSHNPPDTGGFKYNPPHGGPAEETITAWIEERANSLLAGGLADVGRMAIEKALKASTTHRHDFLTAYVEDLHNVIDMDAIRDSHIQIGVNPLGGAGVHYWEPIAARYGLNLVVVNKTVDPTFSFMTLDWDGKIRMDPSSQYAMRPLIALKDSFDLALACDTDHDRHGIVTRSAGLLPPNHYLAVCVDYLFLHRPQWPQEMAVGKTVVTSSMIDRAANRRRRALYEVPVGFKYFVDGLLHGRLGFAGEESAGSSFARRNGSVWTTDKDGIIAALLAAEITAVCKKDPGKLYEELAASVGVSLYRRSQAVATEEQKIALKHITAKDVQATGLAGETPVTILTQAPGDGNPIGGIKVVAANGWFAARPSGTEAIYKIYAESFSGEQHLDEIEAEAQSVANKAFATSVGSSQGGSDSLTAMTYSAGMPYPLGATVCPDGTNFSILSASASSMQLVLFEHADDGLATRTVTLDPLRNRTSHYWHIFLPGIKPGQLYGYRAHGPFDPAAGQRFDLEKILIDPYGKCVAVGKGYSRDAACKPGDNASTSMKSVVADLSQFDWEDDKPINRLFPDTVIYEMHVGGFTRDPSSGVAAAHRGKYLGVIEKIPYLQSLGVTAVELLPVYQFDSSDAPAGLANYWGYDPVSFFAPHLAYSTNPEHPVACPDEFRTMVKALHHAGIEVILDVVYNHTAEGDEHGPTFCFRGLENNFYYILDDSANYADFTGTGNTLKPNHSVVKRMILDSLRYWVSEMHVDGFRFDLASIFSRSETGIPELNAPIIWEIDSDPILAGTKLIAEAWDAGGLYQVGSFGQDKWQEWNGAFRDDVRSFLKSDRSMVWKVRERLIGSPDIYNTGHRPIGQSINYITCHDGFTLNDLVSFNVKHNAANQGQNSDGTNDNFSWNCGVEGPSTDVEVENLRTRQIKNFFALTLLSVGTPMLLMGDEVRRTQQGNNNAYCLDNEVSWFDWNLCKPNAEIFRFVQAMIRLRLQFDRGTIGEAIALEDYLSNARIAWHGTSLNQPDWGPDSHSVAVEVHNHALNNVRYLAINSYWEALEFELPPTTSMSRWIRVIDTSLPSPDDIAEIARGPEVLGSSYIVNPRSIVMLHFSSPRSDP